MLNVSFFLAHETLHLQSSAWLPLVPGGMGTALLNYHLQNKPIQFSAKTNDVTNNNLAVTWHLLLSEDSYLRRIPSSPRQPREAGREGITACTGPRGHQGPQRPRGFLRLTSASGSARLDPGPGSKASAEGAP